MRYVSFELTMPNVGSWNGKWTGEGKKYWIVKSFSEKFFKSDIEKLFEDKLYNNYYYNFGDGWGANVRMELIDSKIAQYRRKNSQGFWGYDWMVNSIMKKGEITTEN